MKLHRGYSGVVLSNSRLEKRIKMDEKKEMTGEEVKEKAENTDGQEKTETQPEQDTQPEKTFTQAEVNKLINDRLAREKAKKGAAANLELEELRAELADFKAKNACYRAGVRDEFLSDVMTLATAGVGDGTDFESALEAVLKRYPNFIKAAPLTTGQKLETKVQETDDKSLRRAFGLKD